MSNIPEKSFDPIAFETKHQADYERSQATAEFNQQQMRSLCFSTSKFSDGRWDGLLAYQPEAYQWATPEYRKGYLVGIEERYNQRFTQNQI